MCARWHIARLRKWERGGGTCGGEVDLYDVRVCSGGGGVEIFIFHSEQSSLLFRVGDALHSTWKYVVV